jgi:hypothetical protein
VLKKHSTDGSTFHTVAGDNLLVAGAAYARLIYHKLSRGAGVARSGWVTFELHPLMDMGHMHV